MFDFVMIIVVYSHANRSSGVTSEHFSYADRRIADEHFDRLESGLTEKYKNHINIHYELIKLY